MSVSLAAQNAENTAVANIFSPNMPQEKVYLHLDNTGYFDGETIHFKAYVMRNDSESYTDISRVLYVELLNPSGDVIATRKCAIVDGQTNGDIKLEKVFGAGYYEIRAYTRYMTNWGNAACFSRVIPIFDTPKNDGDYSNRTIENLSHRRRLPNYRSGAQNSRIGIYPEGGRIVKGLQSSVAFQIHGYIPSFDEELDADDKEGEPYAQLIGADGQVVIEKINIDKFGRGVFEVIPDGTAMTLKAINIEGKDFSVPLPVVSEEGITLTVNAITGKNITANVMGSTGLRGMKFGMMLQHSGTIIATDTFTLGNSPNTLALPREQMPAGISLLTIFDGAGTVLADRMIFITPKENPSDSIRVESKTPILRPCGKVELELTALPNTTFSFSAMDAATMPTGKEGNAKTWMLLSSELKGYIAHPDYYFESDDVEHRRAADLLMMVQGWRKYSPPIAQKIQPIEDKLYLFGQLKQAKKKYGVANVDLSVYLYNTAGESLKGETTTDSLGYYRFELPDCNGEWSMLMYTKKEDKDVNYHVGIDRHFSPKARMMNPLEQMLCKVNDPNLFIISKDKIEDDVLIPLNKRVKVLPTVKVKGKRIFDNAREAWESERNGEYMAQVYYNCDIESDKIADSGLNSPGFFEWLCARNPLFGGNRSEMENSVMEVFENTAVEQLEEGPEEGELITAGVSTTSSTIYDGLMYKNRPIVWILNNDFYMTTGNKREVEIMYIPKNSAAAEMPVFLEEAKSVYIRDDRSTLRNYVVSTDIEGLDPVMIFVYTHHKFLRDVKGLRRTHYQGYNTPETFQMEDYSIMPPMEDFRRTIFWEPNVKTDAQGKAKIEFYNNSSCTQMYISAEGITRDGRYIVNE
jgi:hypothetical protein